MQKSTNIVKRTPTQKLYQAIFNELPAQDMDEEDMPELRKVLSTLTTPREVDILQKFFGIACDHVPMTKIAVAYGLPVNCIHQIRNRALGRLRHPRRACLLKPLFVPRAELRDQIFALQRRVISLERGNKGLQIGLAMIQCVKGEDAETADDEPAIGILSLSARVHNALRAAGVNTLFELLIRTREEIGNIRSIGIKGVEEVEDTLAKLGLSLDEGEEDFGFLPPPNFPLSNNTPVNGDSCNFPLNDGGDDFLIDDEADGTELLFDKEDTDISREELGL